jgi:hypothetical protein
MTWWHHCFTHEKREGKAAGGRVAAAHVGWLLCVLCVVFVVCCVLCVVFCGCVLCFVTFSYHTDSKTILTKSKWPTFAHSYHKIFA